MCKIIVTGCAGFIGSHLTKALLEDGHEVNGIDNFDPFYDISIKKANLNHFLNNRLFTFYEVDLTDEKSTSEIFSRGADIVVHLAGKAGVRPSIEDPQAYIDNNITATRVVLSAMQQNNIRKIAFASSSSVYGNNAETPWHEELNVDNPISPYAFSKKGCELLNHTWHHLYHIDVVNMRFFTVYGPRQRPDLAIHKFTRMLYDQAPLTLFGDGSTARDYTYIDDTINGVLKVIHYLRGHNNVFETINLGNNHPISLNQLVDKLSQITGTAPKIERLPMQPGDVNITYASIDKANRLFGYKPVVSLDSGLRKFDDWFRSFYFDE